MILARFWEAPGPPKIEKNKKNRFVLAFRFEGGFWKGSGRVLGGFWKRFGKVLDGFWKDFVLESRIAFGETCVKRFRLKTLL